MNEAQTRQRGWRRFEERDERRLTLDERLHEELVDVRRVQAEPVRAKVARRHQSAAVDGDAHVESVEQAVLVQQICGDRTRGLSTRRKAEAGQQ